MNFIEQPLAAGLYLVATPIGTARDITLRALDTLASADELVAEDTRTLRKLMEIHGVPLKGRRVHAYHDHSGEAARTRILAAIREGKSVAYASEAGTPLIADPGYALVAAARDAGLPVTSAPGPNAAIAALSIAGLATDRFAFLGFAPTAEKARQSALAAVADLDATLVYYESPRRLAAFLASAKSALGPDRTAALCREITKRFEDVTRGTLSELADRYAAQPVKGECVVLIERAQKRQLNPEDLDAAIKTALTDMGVKDAASHVAQATNTPRRVVYQRALALKKDQL
ncbi:MAG: 16S rRNA (cytidine(1402)-2'-O)-methyltransferase [Pseudomonadota bacterium]